MNFKHLMKHIKLVLSGTAFVVIGVFIVTPIMYILVQFFMLKVFYDKLTTVKVKWAPCGVPLKRRLQTFSVFLVIFFIYFLAPTFLVLNLILMYYANNFGRAVVILSWIYTYYCHYTSLSTTDGNGWIGLRCNILSHYARAYFPVELVKTAELKADKNYLIACFPHGIISFGPLINMSVDIDKWLKAFPCIRPKLATLDVNFCFPFLIRLIQAFGFVSISKNSLLYYLRQSNDPNHPHNRDGFTSNAISISVGGAKEARDYKRGQYNLTLRNRKGFVKIAIISGVSIVPSFTFNEVEVYEQIVGKEGSALYCFQNYAKKLFGIWPSIIVGRGFFQYCIGILPQRRRLVQVGSPIEVRQCDIPDPAYVDEIHQMFVTAIIELFEKYKTEYLYTKDAKLIIT